MSRESQNAAGSAGIYISPDNKQQDNISIEDKKLEEIQAKYPNMYKLYEGWSQGMPDTKFDKFAMDFGHPTKNSFRDLVIKTVHKESQASPDMLDRYKQGYMYELNAGDIDQEENLGSELDRTKVGSILSQITLPKSQFAYTKSHKGDDGESIEYGAIQINPKTGGVVEVKNPRTAKNIIDNYLKNNTPHISQELMFYNPEKLFTDGQWTPENTGYWGGAVEGSRLSTSSVFNEFRSQRLSIGDVSLTPDKAVTLPEYIYEGMKQLGKENNYITDDDKKYQEALDSGKLDPNSKNFIAKGYDFFPEVILAYGRSLKEGDISPEEEGLIDEKIGRLIQEYQEEMSQSGMKDMLVDDGYLLYDITNQKPIDRPITHSEFFNQSFENFREFDVQHSIKKYKDWYDANPVKGYYDMLWGSTRRAYEPWTFGLINYIEESETEKVADLINEVRNTNPELFKHMFPGEGFLGKNASVVSNLIKFDQAVQNLNHVGAFIYYAGKARPFLQPGGTAFTATRIADAKDLATQSKIAEGLTFSLFGRAQEILNPEIDKSVDQHTVDFGLSYLVGYNFPAIGRMVKDLRFGPSGEGILGPIKNIAAFMAQSIGLTTAGGVEGWTSQTYETFRGKTEEGMDAGTALSEAVAETNSLFLSKEGLKQLGDSFTFMTALHAYGILPAWLPIYGRRGSSYPKYQGPSLKQLPPKQQSKAGEIYEKTLKQVVPSKDYHDYWVKSFDEIKKQMNKTIRNIQDYSKDNKVPEGILSSMINKDGTFKTPKTTHERLLIKNYWERVLLPTKEKGIAGLADVVKQLIMQNPNVMMPEIVTTKKRTIKKDGLPETIEYNVNYKISDKSRLTLEDLDIFMQGYRNHMNAKSNPNAIDYKYLNTVENTLLHYITALKSKQPGANIIDSEYVLGNMQKMGRQARNLEDVITEPRESLDPQTHRIVKQWEINNGDKISSIRRTVGDIILETNGEMYINPALPATLKEMLKVAGYTTRDNFKVRTPDGDIIFINKGDIRPPSIEPPKTGE